MAMWVSRSKDSSDWRMASRSASVRGLRCGCFGCGAGDGVAGSFLFLVKYIGMKMRASAMRRMRMMAFIVIRI